ncbi:MAG TPA: hypothetical protein DD727_01805, partial [Clostridiales bacterium]|nr:hypothetical protein [Clostridiales bacterium]
MILDIRRLFTAEEITALSPDEIHQKLTEALRYREDDWQRQQAIPFKGRRLAEHLEYYLHTCPQCKTTGRLASRYDIFTCSACGYRLRYTLSGFFESAAHPQNPV